MSSIPTIDYRALVKKMQVGSDSQLETTVTFPEGYTMEQIFRKLEDNDICSMTDLYEAAAITSIRIPSWRARGPRRQSSGGVPVSRYLQLLSGYAGFQRHQQIPVKPAL
jgi:cell division protein YceG involved in septum cleavage